MMVLELMVRDRLDQTNWPMIGLIDLIQMNQIPKMMVPIIQLARRLVLQLVLTMRSAVKNHHPVEPIIGISKSKRQKIIHFID